MKNLTLSLFLLNVLLLNAQSDAFDHYHKHIQQAYYQDSLGNFDVALQQIDSAFLHFDYYPFDYFDAFTFAFKASDHKKAQHYLIEGTKKGFDVNEWFEDDLNTFLSTDLGRDYLRVKDSLIEKYRSKLDTISINKLKELVRRDQSMRDGSLEMRQQDSLNFNELILLSKTRGFPTFPTTGYGCNDAHLLLWHHRGAEYPNSEQWQEIIPLIETRIKQGLLDPEFLEMFDTYNQSNTN